jgi:hypothetical protein
MIAQVAAYLKNGMEALGQYRSPGRQKKRPTHGPRSNLTLYWGAVTHRRPAQRN